MRSINWLKSLTDVLNSSKGIRRRRARCKSRQCASETVQLEPRILLSATAGFDSVSHELYVQSSTTESLTISSDQSGNVLFNGAVVTDGSNPVSASDVESIRVQGGTGRNVIRLSGVTTNVFTALNSVNVNGNGGNDYIVGSQFDDVIRGGAGDDTINGGLGDDTISGDDGLDRLAGSLGDDTINGGADNDTISGGAGADKLYGSLGDDRLDGNDGNDSIYGQDGIDTANGGTGDDRISGGAGDDILQGINW